MTGRAILAVSVIVLLIGVAILTIAPVSPTAPDVIETRQPWLVPVAYFLMFFAAIGLCWGWFMKRGGR